MIFIENESRESVQVCYHWFLITPCWVMNWVKINGLTQTKIDFIGSELSLRHRNLTLWLPLHEIYQEILYDKRFLNIVKKKEFLVNFFGNNRRRI